MFGNIFRDDNDINEKSVVGFIAFIFMLLLAATDVVFIALQGHTVITEFIYNSFFWLVLGCFGIAEVGKRFGKNGTPEPKNSDKKLLGD